MKQVTNLSSQAELLKFASSYGNCIIEKAFFGGVLCLCFRKGGEEGFQVELGRDVFGVSWQHRGGGPLKVESKKPLSCEQLEKLLRSWAKSFGGGSRKGRNVVVVRLKLAPSSKVGTAEEVHTFPLVVRESRLKKQHQTIAKGFSLFRV